jgi:protein-S-isoprenylcysteine O-methyltransferase Ste14
MIWTFRTLGSNLTDTIVTRQRHTLVTLGPYRYMRHPFYLCGGILALANGLASANAFVLLTGGLAFVLLARRTAKEEELLIARFGDSYRRYREQTGRFIPRFQRSQSEKS